MSLRFACPLSGQHLCHPCPVGRCPANLAALDPHRSCAYVLPETGYDALASIFQVEPAEIRSRSQQQLSDLGELMHFLHKIMEANVDGHCPKCGYLSPCTSPTLCGERQAAADNILVNIKGQGGLKAAHLWYAVLHGYAGFLTDEQRADLLQLANQKHVRSSYGSERKAVELAHGHR